MTDHPEYGSLLKAVKAAPDDDLPRLVLADWLDEHGFPERAEFIRVGCEAYRLIAVAQKWAETPSHLPGGSKQDGGRAGEALATAQTLLRREAELVAAHASKWVPRFPGRLTWRRGFVERVECELGVWTGPPCPRCREFGRQHHGPCMADVGYGRRLLADHPVRFVQATDRSPADRTAVNGRWYWFKHESHHNRLPVPDPSSRLPADLFQLMTSSTTTIGLPYLTPQEAHSALSAALIAWAEPPGRAATPIPLAPPEPAA